MADWSNIVPSISTSDAVYITLFLVNNNIFFFFKVKSIKAGLNQIKEIINAVKYNVILRFIMLVGRNFQLFTNYNDLFFK